MLGGILLTGGASTRMGVDKARLTLAGETFAVRAEELLVPLVALAVEVGPGVSTMFAVREQPAGSGPLAAVVAGHAALREMGLEALAPCLVIACDLPLLTESVLARLASWPTTASVVPVIGGFAQPLCARWSAGDLASARDALAGGERSLQAHPDRSSALLVSEGEWGVEVEAFSDVDSPEDLRRLGLGRAVLGERS